MKKFIIALLFLAGIFVQNNAQATSLDTRHHKRQHHRGHDMHGKGDGHHRGIRLFHRHHHHGKDHSRSDAHSHHGRKGHADKGANSNK